MTPLSGVQATQPAMRDLRPEEDLALLQSYELAEAYDLQEQRMIRPVSVRDDGRYGTPRAALVLDPVARTEMAGHVVPPPSRMPDHAIRPVPPGPRLAPPLPAGHSTTMIEKPDAPEAGIATLPTASATGPARGDDAGDPPALPYGADMGRIRRLVDDLIDGHEQVPLLFQYRQAGDLVAADADPEPSFPSISRVAAVYKAF